MRRWMILPLLACSLWALAQIAGSLTRHVKVGDELRYRTTMKLTDSGVGVTITGDWRERVVRAEAEGGWTVEQTLTGVTLDIGGQKIGTEDAAVAVVEYTAEGLVKSFSRDRAKVDDLRMARVVVVPLPGGPVQRGQEWTRESPADSETRAPSVRTTVRVTGTERVAGTETLRVQVRALETSGPKPISVEGQAWLRLNDGSLVRRVLKLRNAPFGAQGATTDLDWTLELAP